MLKHRGIDRICSLIMALAVITAVLFMNGESLGITAAERGMGYESRLFDTSRVHTLDIVMDDWEGFLETCTQEEYAACTVVIDGEAQKNVGIRAKGNTSLSSVAAYGNNRYSFKLEFDHYQSGNTYYGLDKLSLNNLIQDNTYLKDYLSYTLMREMGVASPLCSFVLITVNGQAWGLYLAVEAVEESFLQRNYGRNYGELYKPDSLSMGANRGNGMNFNMDDFRSQLEAESEAQDENPDAAENSGAPQETPQITETPEMPEGMAFPEGMTLPEGMAFPEGGSFPSLEDMEGLLPQEGGFGGRGGGGGMGARGSADVMLQYVDDDLSSYPNIFDNAKTDISQEDQQRLIQSLKTLSQGEDAASAVDVDAVIRYFVVHNFLCNDDSYTGAMVHNYYLYEEDGVLSMIPWDYNLAFGAFEMGGMGRGGFGSASTGATSTVNSPIDSPVSSGGIDSRPMAAWIFKSEAYTEMYHQVYSEFVDQYFTSGQLNAILESVINLISPYVEKDATAFCIYEEFTKATEVLRSFCTLRGESIAGQLDGTIPTTSEGQSADSSALIDASDISVSDMGSFSGGMGMGGMPSMMPGSSQEGDGENAVRAEGGGGFPQAGGAFPGGGGRVGRSGRGDASASDSAAVSGDITAPVGLGTPDGRDAQRSRGLGNTDGMPFPGGNGNANHPSTAGISSETILLLAVSAAVLLAGLGFVIFYKRWWV